MELARKSNSVAENIGLKCRLQREPQRVRRVSTVSAADYHMVKLKDACIAYFKLGGECIRGPVGLLSMWVKSRPLPVRRGTQPYSHTAVQPYSRTAVQPYSRTAIYRWSVNVDGHWEGIKFKCWERYRKKFVCSRGISILRPLLRVMLLSVSWINLVWVIEWSLHY